ncbi:MAG: flagellar protein [Actinobacteria bacterium]|nr:flagellar protein [Actinomycetota bacterium]
MKVQGREQSRQPLIIPQPAAEITRNRPVDTPAGNVRANPVKQNFGEVLSAEFKKSADLKLSAHAERRLRERNVILDREDMQKIEGAVHKAAAKGSRESLVIYGDLALVANIKNKTIITAMEGKDMNEHVFTNIDSAVFIRKGDTPA